MCYGMLERAREANEEFEKAREEMARVVEVEKAQLGMKRFWNRIALEDGVKKMKKDEVKTHWAEMTVEERKVWTQWMTEEEERENEDEESSQKTLHLASPPCSHVRRSVTCYDGCRLPPDATAEEAPEQEPPRSHVRRRRPCLKRGKISETSSGSDADANNR